MCAHVCIHIITFVCVYKCKLGSIVTQSIFMFLNSILKIKHDALTVNLRVKHLFLNIDRCYLQTLTSIHLQGYYYQRIACFSEWSITNMWRAKTRIYISSAVLLAHISCLFNFISFYEVHVHASNLIVLER